MTNLGSSSRAIFEAKNSESVAIIDVTTLFDPINHTFSGFDPQKTWPCSNAESVIVDYVNGHGGHDARIPITDFGVTSLIFYMLSFPLNTLSLLRILLFRCSSKLHETNSSTYG